MDANEDDSSTINTIKIKKTEVIDSIIDDVFVKKNELGITLFPYNQFFKTYLIEIKPKYLVIDSLMPFYGNKLVHKTDYLKINIMSDKQSVDKHFLTKYKEEIFSGGDYNFFVYKPLEIVLTEKRKVLRVATNASNTAYIYSSYKKIDFSYSLRDLSWNGISFDADIDMKPDSILKNALIKLSGRITNMDLKIVHSTYLKGKYRIGCEILKISDKDRDILINFIHTIERQNININW